MRISQCPDFNRDRIQRLVQVCLFFIEVFRLYYREYLSLNTKVWLCVWVHVCVRVRILCSSNLFTYPVVVQQPVNSHTPKSSMSQALGLKTTKCFSILLIVCGLLMFVLQLTCLIIVEEARLWRTAHEAGTGIWCGILITLGGVIGCCAASKKTNALVRFVLCTCIIILSPRVAFANFVGQFFIVLSCSYLKLHVFSMITILTMHQF